MILENLLTIFGMWAPLFGILFLCVKMKARIWLPFFEAAFLGLAASLFFIRFSSDPSLMFSLSLAVYPLCMAVMLPIFSRKYDFNRALALTLCLGFLITGLQEIWGFIRLDLGMYDNILALEKYAAWYLPLNHLFYVAIGVISLWIARFSRKRVWDLLFWVTLGLLLEWIIYPNIQLGSYGLWDVARRVLWLPLLLLIFYRDGTGLKTKDVDP